MPEKRETVEDVDFQTELIFALLGLLGGLLVWTYAQMCVLGF